MKEQQIKQLSVVVPCFNEQDVIQMTHDRLVGALGSLADYGLEVVYVNDGSSDDTESMLFALAAAEPRVRVVSLARNFGHQPAVTAGLVHASGDVVAIIDADLQDPPEVIPEMLKLWRDGYEVVYGVRTRRKEGILKRAAYASFYRLYKLLANIDMPLDSGDFALLDRRVVDVLNGLPEKNRFLRGLRTWAGFRQTGYTYERAARAAGEPKYSFRALMRLAFDGIFNFSTTPLTLIFVAGAIISGLAAIAALVYLAARVWGFSVFGQSPEDVPGFTTLILTILFFSGVQLISVGILGEYLGRIYQETKMRPTYVIKELREKDTDDSASFD
ncbi:MAG: glycosyltransferase family 2 protein [Gammaproteobacteria bacterium]|nr:glycosyltransferase family 2 protein [Gammaproteobacteria bacterium]